MTALLILIAALTAINLLLLFLRTGGKEKISELKASIEALDKVISRVEASLKNELARSREEAGRASKDAREELAGSMRGFEKSVLDQMTNISVLQKNQLGAFSEQLAALTKSNEERLERMTKATEEKLDKMRQTVEERLKSLQEDNSGQLEKMRNTVDEKLHKTLEERLSQSFKLVSERLELVHKGLGEMQTLAVGVGDLKKVLSNVKTRGILGEIQLGNILEQILTPEQYEKNMATKKGSRDFVEFAIRLPGTDDSGVYLPLDSKFPIEMYHALVDAYEHGDTGKIDEAGRALETGLKKCARDIRDKYIDPPNTTDFGIMYLPTEGLYAEALRRPGLFEVLQREMKVNITGPTTLAAFLNSLQMGFRTLAIEKRSSEVWKVLGAVKTEFERFGDVLKKAQDKLNEASGQIDSLVGVRTRQIQRKLKDVQEMTSEESARLLDTTDEQAS